MGILNNVALAPAPVLCRAPPPPRRIRIHVHVHNPALTLARVLTRALYLALAHLGMLTAFIFFFLCGGILLVSRLHDSGCCTGQEGDQDTED